MTLENMLRQQLSNPESGGFHFDAGGWSVTLAADKNDSLSCALRELTLEKSAAIPEELQAWAACIAERVSGLLEPLTLIEVDQPLGKALLRSRAPTVRDGKSCYYELFLERTSITAANLRRYAGDRQLGEKREAVPFVLTHDAIVKLVTDIVGKN
jgi:hypothetical protein